jgi:hypothetical protein
MTTYTDRVDALAAEALTPDVDGGQLTARQEELIHELLEVLACAYRDDELERRREQHPIRVVAGHKARATHLRVVL